MNNDNDMTLAGYDVSVEEYIKTSPQTVSPELRAWIDKNLSRLKKTASILEIGSGSGKDAVYFASRGYQVELTDASQGFVDHLNNRGMDARLLNALTDELGKDYDMVFADAVFLHFTPVQLKMVLRKVLDSLQPNGRILFSLKIGNGDEITDRKLNVARYFCYWDTQNISNLLDETGYKDLEITSTDDYRGKTRHGWLLISAVKPM